MNPLQHAGWGSRWVAGWSLGCFLHLLCVTGLGVDAADAFFMSLCQAGGCPYPWNFDEGWVLPISCTCTLLQRLALGWVDSEWPIDNGAQKPSPFAFSGCNFVVAFIPRGLGFSDQAKCTLQLRPVLAWVSLPESASLTHRTSLLRALPRQSSISEARAWAC